MADLAAGRDLVQGQEVPTPGSLSRTLSHFLDELIRIPRTRVTFGADALMSLIPGVGGAAANVLSGVILLDAVRCRVPLLVLLRMLANVAFDWAVGFIPIAGPVIDAGFRANTRNLRLLDRAITSGRTSRRRGLGYLLTAVAMIVVVVLGLAVLGIVGIAALLTALSNAR